jgi:hypothetical protein
MMKENEGLLYIVDKLKGDVMRLEKEVDEMHQVRQAVKQQYEDEIADLKFHIERMEEEVVQ